MIGDPGVIARLKAALVAETRSAMQYEIHSALLDNLGYAGLAEHERKEAKDERGHFRRYADRLTLLGSDLVVDNVPAPIIGATVQAMLAGDLELERGAVTNYGEAAVYCRNEAGDLVSANLFESILADEEGHVNWLEMQLAAIDTLGLDLYLQRQFGAE